MQKKGSKYRAKVYQAYRYNLEFDDSCIDNPEGLNVKVFIKADREWVRFILMKIFNKADREWVRFILENRNSDSSVHDFDIVIGPTADENTVTVINSYKDELEETDYADEVLDALIKELEPENLPKQYFFGTRQALSKLHFKKVRREIVG